MTAIYKSESGAALVGERYARILQHWPVPNQQIRVPTSQGETFVVACGPENAPPVVLHNLGDQSQRIVSFLNR